MRPPKELEDWSTQYKEKSVDSSMKLGCSTVCKSSLRVGVCCVDAMRRTSEGRSRRLLATSRTSTWSPPDLLYSGGDQSSVPAILRLHRGAEFLTGLGPCHLLTSHPSAKVTFRNLEPIRCAPTSK